MRNLTRHSNFSVISQGTAQRNNTDYLAHINKMVKKALSKALSRLLKYSPWRSRNCTQTWARNSCKRVTSWERCDGRFNNRLWQKHIFTLFALARLELSAPTIRVYGFSRSQAPRGFIARFSGFAAFSAPSDCLIKNRQTTQAIL